MRFNLTSDIGLFFYPSIVSESKSCAALAWVCLMRTKVLEADAGYKRYLDWCTATPFLTNEEKKTLVTYDDEVSVCYKKQFTTNHKMAGTGFFDIRGLDEEGRFLAALTGASSGCVDIKPAGQNIMEGTVSMGQDHADATGDTGSEGDGSSGGPDATGSDGESSTASDTEKSSSTSESSDSSSDEGGAAGALHVGIIQLFITVLMAGAFIHY